jgi:hypothetical protein
MKTELSYFFVLGGLLNGERGVHATTAGFGAKLEDGWYFLPVGAADGTGPYPSRDEAVEASQSVDRFFLFPLDDNPAEIREIPDEYNDSLGDGNVVLVRRVANGCLSLSIEGSYDTYELLVNQPLETALRMFQAALAVERS